MLRVVVILVSVLVGCGASNPPDPEATPPPPQPESSEQTVGDGRHLMALPDDGSLGDLEGILLRHRDDETPVMRIVIHTARTASADTAVSYLDAIRRLTRGLELDPEIHIGGPAEAPHLTIVTRHRPPLGP